MLVGNFGEDVTHFYFFPLLLSGRKKQTYS